LPGLDTNSAPQRNHLAVRNTGTPYSRATQSPNLSIFKNKIGDAFARNEKFTARSLL